MKAVKEIPKNYKGLILISQNHDDGSSTTIVWHPLFWGPIEDFLKNDTVIVSIIDEK